MTHDTNIPHGYKATALGIIPQEWEVRPLNYLGAICSGGTPDTEVAEYWNGDIAWCTPSDITKLDTKYIESTEVKITAKGLKESSATLLPPRSIVVCTRATIGSAAICNTEIATNQGFKNIIPNEKANPEWLYYIIIYSKPRLVRIGCGSTFLEVSKKDFSRFKIVVPPLAEQRKIAEVLGVWDEAIEKQARLIEKLALRKRGLMQRLLSAKLRLPGFSEPWQKVKLGEICERVTRKNIEDNQNVMTISAQRGFVAQTDFFNKSVASETLESYYLVFKDEFCYNKSYSNGYPMGAIKRLSEADKAVVTSLYICFNVKPETNTNIDYLSYYFDNGGLNRGLTKIANEGGRAHGLLNVTPKDFFGLSFEIPSLKEQTAIAEVLIAADREIELAKEKLERLRRQKRGLMQQLLSGKKRVKINI
ncbi:restriction endonuclease subunit S [Alistipes putredinis]|uniref:restriction endonuclease subunit S n=1 Tax=Alistipes putredinis TaxID=28117 RepID=UPI003AAA5285